MTDRRLLILQVSALVAFATIALQLVRMQLLDPITIESGSNGERLRSLPIEPPRGLVTDRNGVVIARNVPEFSVVVVPGELPEDENERRKVLLTIERQLMVPYATIENALSNGLATIDPFAPVTLRGGLDRNAAIELRAALAGLPGIAVHIRPVRIYEEGTLLAHVLGFVGPIAPEEVEQYLDRGYPLDARVGRTGVEAIYETELRGAAGWRLVLSDPAGRELERLGETPVRAGADLVLSIDLRLQRAASAALNDGIEKGIEFALSKEIRHGGPLKRTGAAMLMDVRNGEVLALVSYPSYDVNVFSGQQDDAEIERLLTDETQPLINRSFMEVNAPGSIFKPFVGAAALEEGVATPSTQITSTGAITVQSQYDPSVIYTFKDWAAHGTLDFYGGLVRSSDVYYYYLSGGYARDGQQLFEGLGPDRIADYVRAFGLGTPTGLDLPGEAAGLVPDSAWKNHTVGEPWVLGDTYAFGIGQGYLVVTPIQMAVAMAALANGGKVLEPRVVHALRVGSELHLIERGITSTLPIGDDHLEVVREALRMAADPGGTAYSGEPEGVEIGGKTGTAEFGRSHPDGELDSHGWFLGFAPYEQPEVAVVVYLRHGIGSTHAAPVARTILEAYFALQTGSEHAAARLDP